MTEASRLVRGRLALAAMDGPARVGQRLGTRPVRVRSSCRTTGRSLPFAASPPSTGSKGPGVTAGKTRIGVDIDRTLVLMTSGLTQVPSIGASSELAA